MFFQPSFVASAYSRTRLVSSQRRNLLASPFFWLKSFMVSATVLAILKIETAVQSPWWGLTYFLRPMTSVESRQCCRVAFRCERFTPGRNFTGMAHLRRQRATFRSNHSIINPNCFPMAAKRSRFSGEPIASREPSSRLTS